MFEKTKETFNAIKETSVDSVIDTIKSRTANPLAGGFLLSWLFLNWDRIAIFFLSPVNISKRIDLIHAIPDYLPLGSFNLPHFYTFILPIFLSIFYVVGIPRIIYIIDVSLNKVLLDSKTNSNTRFVDEYNASMEYHECKHESMISELDRLVDVADRQAKIETLSFGLENKRREYDRLNSFISKNAESVSTSEKRLIELSAMIKSAEENLDARNDQLNELRQKQEDADSLRLLLSDCQSRASLAETQLSEIISRQPVPPRTSVLE